MHRKLFLRKLYYASLLICRGGIGALVRLFWSQINSTTNYIWLAKNLTPSETALSTNIPYSVQLASPEVFRTILSRVSRERGQDVYEILRRISFYQRGFDNCYLELTDSQEVCHMAWLLSSSHNDLIQSQYPSGMNKLKEADVLLENIFTFNKYRGKGAMTSMTGYLADLAKRQGFQRVLAYVDIENKVSLRAFLRAGFYYCGNETETRHFFRIWRSGFDYK